MDDMTKQLEAEQRLFLMAMHIYRCITLGVPPEPTKVDPSIKDVCETFRNIYARYWPPPPTRTTPPGLSQQRLIDTYRLMDADGTATNNPELTKAIRFTLEWWRMINNYGTPYYMTEMWYQRTWVTIRSEEAMAQEGEFA